MIWKIVVILSVALCAQSEEDAISEQRVTIHHHKSHRGGSLSHDEPKKCRNHDEYANAYPSYEFSYSVKDPKTHDIKGQHETREGDEVTGKYWLIEPNGQKRTVNYQSKDDEGFNAQIYYTGTNKEEEKNEDINEGQKEEKEQGNLENNNVEGVDITIGEEIQENKNESEGGHDPAPVVENNLSEQSESDGQKDEGNNIADIERVDVDQNEDSNLAQSNQIVAKSKHRNLENNERNSGQSPKGNDTEQNKGRYSNKNHNGVPSGNVTESNHGRPRNSKRSKHDDSKRHENNNRNANKRKKTSHDKNLRNSGNESNGLNNKKSALTGEIQRKNDIPQKEETYEHRIRIYHPKIISTISKEARKH